MRWIRECSFFILGFALWAGSLAALPYGVLNAGETLPPTSGSAGPNAAPSIAHLSAFA